MSNSLSVSGIDISANDNADVQLVPMLIALSKTTHALLGLRLAALGLRSGQDEVLMAVDAVTATSATAIAGRLGIRPSTARLLLGQLADKRLVEGGSRAEGFTTTQAGVDTQNKVNRMYRQLETDLLPSQSPSVAVLADLQDLQDRLLRLLSTFG